MQERTTRKLLSEPQARTGSRLYLAPQARTEVKNQVKQVDQISEATRRLTLIVGILLLITLVIISTNIFFSQHGQVLGDVFVIFLIIILLIILPFLNRIFTIIYNEKARD